MSSLQFLAGGGEMGARIRAFDWTKTPLGPPETWPQSLRSPLSMMLPSKAQIALFWGPEYVILYNDAYRPVFGAKHPDMLGQPGRVAWSEIWDAGVNLHGLLDGVVRTGEAFSAHDLLFTLERHGFVEETYFDVSYDPVRDESGAVGGVFCIVTETTGRVIGERRLALLRDLAAHETARSSRDACAVAMQTFAARPQDVPFALAYLDGEMQPCTPGAEAALAAASPGGVAELPIAVPTGSESGRLVVGLNARRPFDEQYRAFLDLVAGQLATAIAGARAYEEEKKRAEALAEVDRVKTAFFSNVSHEFRTPLTLMLGPLEEVLARPEAQDRELLSVVQRNGQRLLKLVNTLLDFARIEAGRAQAYYRDTDLSTLTADLASNFRSACEKAGLLLRVDCPSEVRAWVDGEMWEKIVLNLISNAFKFTLEGGIAVRLEDAGSLARLVVSDTGTGIPSDALNRVFERFHRIEGARGRSHEGSGIGLALVQELVRLHGGSISVESEPGRGTTFSVEIPKGRSHLPAAALADAPASQHAAHRAQAYVAEALGWLGAAPEPAAPAAIGSARVLVADDNADLRDYARRLLAGQFDVETVADGVAALESARARPPDLILSDVMMPRLDGFGLIRELRRDPALAAIPVVLLSARAGEEARLEGLQYGADDYLVKPFSGRELLGRVAAALQSAASRRRASEYEQRFRTFVQASSDVVYSMSADWGEMRSLQGRDFIADQDEPNRSWLEKYLHPDDQPLVRSAIAEAIRTKGPFQLEHRVLRVDGTLGWTFSRAIPILDERGDIVEWLGAASDVTARKRAEQALLEARAQSERQKRLYEAILTNTPDFAYVWNLDHRFIYANEGLLQMWGKTWDEAIGRNCLELGYEPWHAAMHDREIDQIAATGQPLRGEVPFAGTFGPRIYDYILVPVFGPDGKVEAVAGTTRDVTDYREGERRKDEFIATLAHELRNPLAPISNALYAMRMRSGGAEDPLREILERQIRHLVRLVDDLLEMSRITRGFFELRRETVELSSVVRNAVETSQPLMQAGRHRLDVSMPGEPLWLHGDPVRLAQILSNLLNNAAKYTDDGGVITLTTRREEDKAVVSVRDNGRGIARERLSRIFDMFSREGRESARFQGGLGIGLTLALRLAEMHGGTVEALSEGEGRGSEFIVRLPLVATTAHAASKTAEAPVLAKPMRVLVVDDNEDAASSLGMLLEVLGAEVRLAHDGVQALEAYAASEPAVVLLDIGMPGMDGYEVARRLRGRDPERRTTLIALTGWGQEEDRRRARDAGFDHHLIKPAEIGKLQALLAELSGRTAPPRKGLSSRREHDSTIAVFSGGEFR
jgi:PAS domain S-box-containing protein